MPPTSKPGPVAIVIPACNEGPCLGQVLDELLSASDPDKFVVAVGVNASTDRTAEIARARGVLVAETSKRGYGYGCQAAIDLLKTVAPQGRAYIFLAGGGASHPRPRRKFKPSLAAQRSSANRSRL